MKKILLTGANGMLAHDFIKTCSSKYDIVACDKDALNITNYENVFQVLEDKKPDIVLNCAAYTAVDDAEDIGKKLNFDINTLWVFYLAKACKELDIDFITISTDYVFDGSKSEWYNENDICNPINEYGMSKYLWEKLALKENKNTIIVRTSWLYWWGKDFKNFVNTILKLSETRNELKVVNDQFWVPTFTKDLVNALSEVIETIGSHKWKIFHFSNSSQKRVTWFDFASEIFKLSERKTIVIPCSSSEFVTKAKRPTYSYMKNNSIVRLRDWKDGVKDYLNNL